VTFAPPVPRRVAVFASGGGSNLGALLSHFNSAASPIARVVVVLADRPGIGALARAAAAGVSAAVLADPADGDALNAILAQHRVDLVVLAGYLRLVPTAVTKRFAGRMLNVHPALLPRHGGPGMYGARVHRAVLAAGDTESGATVHFVDAAYDRGAPVAWARVPVHPGDTAETLAARVLVGEHFILPRAVEALAAGLLRLDAGGRVHVDPAAQSLFANPPPGVQVRLATGPVREGPEH
jgi:formyltetrahydrofolate-dependent phosphoribosylglycinamide formyltransferase